MQRPLYQVQDRQELVRLKEAFVSNLPGTTRWEVFCVLSSLPLCLLIGEGECVRGSEGEPQQGEQPKGGGR